MVVRVQPSPTQLQNYKAIYERVQRIIQVNCIQMIQILRVHERRGKDFTIDYEYVREGLKTSGRLGEPAFVSALKEKLLNFSQVIASHCIKINLSLDRIGLKEGEPKIFLGLDFVVVP